MVEALGVGNADLSTATITSLSEAEWVAIGRQSLCRVQVLGRHACEDAVCRACYGSLLYALNKLEEDYG